MCRLAAVALALLALVPAATAQDFLRLAEEGDRRAKAGDRQGAAAVFRQGLERGRSLGDQKAVAAFAYELGKTYKTLGETSQALDYFQQAARAARASGRNHDEFQAHLLSGNIRIEAEDMQGARTHYEEALKVAERAGSETDQAFVLSNLAVTYDYEGAWSLALERRQKALAVFRKTKDRLGEAAALAGIGAVQVLLGDFAEGLGKFELALAISREIQDKSLEAKSLGNLGSVYESLGDLDRAISSIKKSMELQKTLGDRAGEALALWKLGKIHAEQGDSSSALEALRESSRLRKELGLERELAEGDIADVYLEQGRFEQALELYRGLGDDLGLGRYFLAVKDYGQAQKHYEAAMRSARVHNEPGIYAASHSGMGLSLEGAGVRGMAASYFETSQGLLESLRSRLQEKDRLRFFSVRDHGLARTEPSEGLVRLWNSSKAEDPLYYAESTRNRLFAESLAGRHRAAGAVIPRDLAERESELSSLLASAWAAFQRAKEAGDARRQEEVSTELAGLEKREEELIAELRRRFPEYASIHYPRPVFVKDVPLAADEVLLEYEVTGPAAYIIVVRRPTGEGNAELAAFVKIPTTRKELEAKVRAYRAAFECVEALQAGRYDPRLGRELYGLLLQPVLEAGEWSDEPLVTPRTRVIIVPDEILGVLPFEALVRDVPARYVGDDYDIAYAQSATALVMSRSLRRASQPKKQLFVLADPVFDDSDPRAEKVSGALLASVRPAGGGLSTRDIMVKALKPESGLCPEPVSGGTIVFPRLKATGAAAERLQGLFGPGKSDALVGNSADERSLRKADLGQYRYLSFETHGILDSAVPYVQEPALVLSQPGSGQGDGFLTMSEVLGLSLNADVAVLSACKTGLGRRVRGEGVMGLGRAFQHAGARAVLVSLWSVADESTAVLEEAFFTLLRDGKSKRSALRLARAELRRQGYEHPFFWAPFILIGD